MSIIDFTTALPGGAAPVNQILLRAAIIGGLVHFIEEDVDPQEYNPVDSNSGSVAQVVGWHEAFWWRDEDDDITDHDGITCIVLADAGRYKVTAVDPWHGYAVLSFTETVPPSTSSSPEVEIGHVYLVPAGATGDWAGKEDYVAIYTARGWHFVPPRVGRMIYVRDEASYYHYSVTGEWIAGIGNSAFADESIAPVKLVQGVTKWLVQEIGTNTPPTIVKGINYIVGSSPTGAFLGHVNHIATSDDGLDWDFYVPSRGWEVFNLADNLVYRFDGTTWASIALGYASAVTNLTEASAVLTNTWSSQIPAQYSPTTPPSQASVVRFAETVTLAVQADFVNQRFEIRYMATVTAFSFTLVASDSPRLLMGIHLDSVNAALDWGLIWRGVAFDSLGRIDMLFEFALPDTSPHTLSFHFYPIIVSGSSFTAASLTVSRRRTIVRKKV